MDVVGKPDADQAAERLAAWWEGELVDRAVVQVTAPRAGLSRADLAPLNSPVGLPQADMLAWFTDLQQVLPRMELRVASTFWGGEAIPVAFPVSTSLVAILAAYLGCPYAVTSGTGWADPIVTDWANRPRFAFDPHNEWWLRSRRLLEAAAEQAAGRYFIGLPDLNGPSQILALLRDPQQLALDLIDDPIPLPVALDEVNRAWLRYYQASVGAVHQYVGDYFFWMGIWSDRPAVDLQNDFSCLISTRMFDDLFLPGLEEQTRWVERTIYHLDGPGAIRHLDALLSLPRLTGIQWVPGAGAAPMSHWIRLLRRIQAGGKRLVLACEPQEVEVLLAELEPEGLLLSTSCPSEEGARDLLAHVPGWMQRRQWAAAPPLL